MSSIIMPFSDLGFNGNRYRWIVKPPLGLRVLFPSVLWRKKVEGKSVFLTFDDGPVPGVTPWVIELLRSNNAVATFFCVGDNVQKYPGVYKKLKAAGHATGSHSFSHKTGRWFGLKTFLADVERDIQQRGERPKLFRPPHGVFFPWLLVAFQMKQHRVVMWDVLSCDYDRSLSPDKVIYNVIRHIRPGSIVVFHDSLKAWPNLKVALPAVLSWIKENGYTTALLNSEN